MLRYLPVYIHGAVAAIVGDPESPTLKCSFVKKKNGHNQRAVTLAKDFSEKLDLENPNAVKAACKRFVATLHEVIELQQKEGEHRDKIIPVILGFDGRQKYPFSKLSSSLYTACKEYMQERSKSIDELLSKISIKLRVFNDPLVVPKPIDDNEQYVKQVLDYNLSAPMKVVNAWLWRMKERILSGDMQVIAEATACAYLYGKIQGRDFKANIHPDERFVVCGIPDERINMIPLLDCWSWHPRIRNAFRKGFAAMRGSKKQIVVKGINEPANRPFVDIVDCFIQDSFQGIKGKLPKEIRTTILKGIADLRRTCKATG
jgi:hypothetical protein